MKSEPMKVTVTSSKSWSVRWDDREKQWVEMFSDSDGKTRVTRFWRHA